MESLAAKHRSVFLSRKYERSSVAVAIPPGIAFSVSQPLRQRKQIIIANGVIFILQTVPFVALDDYADAGDAVIGLKGGVFG